MKHIPSFDEFVNESAKTEKWAVFFYDDHKDDILYTLQYWDSRMEAINWAESHEFSYDDEQWDPRHEDYVMGTYYRYHNPEDKESYNGYEVKKIKV